MKQLVKLRIELVPESGEVFLKNQVGEPLRRAAAESLGIPLPDICYSFPKDHVQDGLGDEITIEVFGAKLQGIGSFQRGAAAIIKETFPMAQKLAIYDVSPHGYCVSLNDSPAAELPISDKAREILDAIRSKDAFITRRHFEARFDEELDGKTAHEVSSCLMADGWHVSWALEGGGTFFGMSRKE